MQINLREDSVEISGYVNAVERNSKPLVSRLGKFVERIRKGAFSNALQRDTEVFLLLNHDKSRVLGSTKQGNLELTEDSIGLHARATVTDPEVIEEARNGDLVGWSFGFYDIPDGVDKGTDEETNLPLRKLRDLDLREVSILDRKKTPAYDGTLLMARADDDNMFIAEPYTEEDTGTTTAYTIDASNLRTATTAQITVSTEGTSPMLRYNKNHDALGRFAPANGGGGVGSFPTPMNGGSHLMTPTEYEMANEIIEKEGLDLKVINGANKYGDLATTIEGSGADYEKLTSIWRDRYEGISKQVSKEMAGIDLPRLPKGYYYTIENRVVKIKYGDEDQRSLEDSTEDIEERYNKNHDALGRFASSGGGGSAVGSGGNSTSQETLAVAHALQTSGKATTTNEEVANMYAQNANPYFDYKVDKTGDSYEITASKSANRILEEKLNRTAFKNEGNGQYTLDVKGVGGGQVLRESEWADAKYSATAWNSNYETIGSTIYSDSLNDIKNIVKDTIAREIYKENRSIEEVKANYDPYDQMVEEMRDNRIEERYNKNHDALGRFAPSGGSGGGGLNYSGDYWNGFKVSVSNMGDSEKSSLHDALVKTSEGYLDMINAGKQYGYPDDYLATMENEYKKTQDMVKILNTEGERRRLWSLASKGNNGGYKKEGEAEAKNIVESFETGTIINTVANRGVKTQWTKQSDGRWKYPESGKYDFSSALLAENFAKGREFPESIIIPSKNK